MPPRNSSKSETKGDTMVKKYIDDVKKEEADDNVCVGRVTKFLGNKRFEVIYDLDGVKTTQARVPGKFSGRGRKGALVSVGSFVLLAEDKSIKSFEMLALIKGKYVELINSLSPINPSIMNCIKEDASGDGIDFEREVAEDDDKKEIEDSDIDDI